MPRAANLAVAVFCQPSLAETHLYRASRHHGGARRRLVL